MGCINRHTEEAKPEQFITRWSWKWIRCTQISRSLSLFRVAECRDNIAWQANHMLLWYSKNRRCGWNMIVASFAVIYMCWPVGRCLHRQVSRLTLSMYLMYVTTNQYGITSLGVMSEYTVLCCPVHGTSYLFHH